MNYYVRHIGDYLKATAHLSLVEHGVYCRLLDVYYSREKPIPAAQVERLISVRTKEEREALRNVLEEFFTVNGDLLCQGRCDREIERYRDKQSKASASANARWKNSQSQTERSANAMRTHCEGNAPSSQSPITSNQESSAPSGYQQHAGPQDGPDGPARAGFSENPWGTAAGGADAAVQVAQAAGTAMRAAGLADVSDSHPTLLALLAGGITVAELADAARVAVQKGRGFPWALARAEGQRRDAEASAGPLPAAAPPVDPDGRAAIEADGERFGLGRWQQLDAHGRSVSWATYAAKVKSRRKAEAGRVTA